jgi:predicted SAM-dependent methyltransferase
MKAQIGITIDCLLHPSQKTFIDKDWVHLGSSRIPAREELLKNWCSNLRGKVNCFIDGISGQQLLNKYMENISQGAAFLRTATNFLDYFYTKGSRLPFNDLSISFIYSEHFFEHLFLDEAGELLKECFRVLKHGGVIRTAVPDADLRTYEPAEPAEFTVGGKSWNDPQKHKSRWSVYSFGYLLTMTGFKPFPFVYCDRDGNYVKKKPGLGQTEYTECIEKDLIGRTDYIKRLNHSLCIDGIKA